MKIDDETRGQILEAAWAVKVAPKCDDRCPYETIGGLCTCGNLGHRMRAGLRFRRLVTPDMVIALLRGVSHPVDPSTWSDGPPWSF